MACSSGNAERLSSFMYVLTVPCLDDWRHYAEQIKLWYWTMISAAEFTAAATRLAELLATSISVVDQWEWKMLPSGTFKCGKVTTSACCMPVWPFSHQYFTMILSDSEPFTISGASFACRTRAILPSPRWFQRNAQRFLHRRSNIRGVRLSSHSRI